ncbi:Lrp/AsnC family transcriptional regulator [Jatrophihabitans sp.]|uniref:Lrp/AsnC family transcriptional regulator n=1 Tax=Jatrophihabitans sp. TaxID=1932789 RepID=UPI0030C70CC6
MDALDVRLVELLSENPRVGVLELARLAGVARATVSARLERLQSSGVITGYGPTIDLAAAGYPVQAIATLEVAQGRLEDVASLLAEMPGVLEAVATTGTHDVVCRLAAASNEELQSVLLDLSRSDVIRRSTSVVVLSVLIPPRTLPLLQQERRPSPRRAPSFRG